MVSIGDCDPGILVMDTGEAGKLSLSSKEMQRHGVATAFTLFARPSGKAHSFRG